MCRLVSAPFGLFLSIQLCHIAHVGLRAPIEFLSVETYRLVDNNRFVSKKGAIECCGQADRVQQGAVE